MSIVALISLIDERQKVKKPGSVFTRFFTRIAVSFAGEANLFVLAKAASKDDFLRTIFVALGKRSVVGLLLFNVLSSGSRAWPAHL
jgi:hypothetical protein